MKSSVHNVAHWIAHWANQGGDRPALVDATRRLSYRALAERVARLAGWLRGQGVSPGDRVGLVLRNAAPCLESVLAIAHVGAVGVPVNWRLSPREMAFLLTDSGASLLIHEEEFAETVDGACNQVDGPLPRRLSVAGRPDAYERALQQTAPDRRIQSVAPETPMTLMYTSGTTGEPKGALLPHKKTLFNCLNAQLFFEIRPEDRVLVATPLFHSLGLNIMALPALYAGACVYLQPNFDTDAVWACIERERIHYMGGVPTQYLQLFEALEAGSGKSGTGSVPQSLRFLFTAGAAIPENLVGKFHERGLDLMQGYGQTETSIITCLDRSNILRKAGSVGRPVTHAEVRIVPHEQVASAPGPWRACPAGEVGEIVVRGPITMTGYWERPEATAEVLREGWLRTTDLGQSDDEGFVTLVGRARDMIISGGENVYPAEIEQVLASHPDIREVAVVGIPDDAWGEAARAHVVLEPHRSLQPAALRAWARDYLAPFKIPRVFRAEKDLPRTITGKVVKDRLRTDLV